MARPFRPGYVTANDLVTGAVIYLSAEGLWVTHPEAAERIDDPARAEARLALAEAQPEIAVSPYFAPLPAEAAAGALRELLRASGPSAPARVSWGAAHV